MTAAKYDINIDQGSDFSIGITVSDSNGVRNLSNFSARASMRPSASSPDSDATDFSFDLTNRANGIIIMQLTHTVSRDMTAGTYLYDLEIFQGSAPNEESVTRLMQGKVVINPEVTK